MSSERLNMEWGIDRTGLKILHWPGELRKPWQRYAPVARSAFDQMWWDAYRGMCRDSKSGPRKKYINEIMHRKVFIFMVES